jgi:S-adenosylmethionine-diacylglycerol 3-amino-3-carboxypropyl transferase
MSRDATLSMVGVPRAQRRQVETEYEGGIVRYIQDRVEAVFARLPLSDNYFWRVYITGQYSAECCPEYLKPDNFRRLREGLADRISIHTNSVQGFLEEHDVAVSRFVLLDHMDWMSDRYLPLLAAEWQAIIDRAAPGARAIWRSGGLRTDFVDNVKVRANGRMCWLGDLLVYHRELAAKLHAKCRVHTYGSFHIADLAA